MGRVGAWGAVPPVTSPRSGSTRWCSPVATWSNRPHPRPHLLHDQGSQTYLQVVDDTVFNGGNWIPQFDSAIEQTIPAGPIARDQTALERPAPRPPSASASRTPRVPRPADSGGSLGLFPGGPDLDQSPRDRHRRCHTRCGDPGGHATPALRLRVVGDSCPSGSLTKPTFLDVDEVSIRSGTIDSLETSGSVSTATVAELENAGTDYPSWVQSDADPILGKGASAQNVSQANAISSLAERWTQGTSNPYAAASAIEAHLRGGRIRLHPGSPEDPSGEWPIVYFLDSSHQGYCQYYASAMERCCAASASPPCW